MIYQSIIDAVEVCARKGISRAIISPGSRNAPLTLAFARHATIESLVVPDERSAAFIALGMAKTLGQPVVLVCTSGSAAYNYAPAVAEAYYSKIPLIVLTADRAPEWIDQQDGQTIRQRGIYGTHIKESFQFPDVITHPDQQWAGIRMVNDAINLATGPQPGPVHINVPLREPFYPGTEEVHASADLKVIDRKAVDSRLPDHTVQELKAVLNKSTCTLVVLGQMDHDPELIEVMDRITSVSEVPVIADVISNGSSLKMAIRHHDLFLGQLSEEDQDKLSPDVLITVGGSVISKNLKLFLRRHKPQQHWHIGEELIVADTFQSLTTLLPVSTRNFFMALSDLGKPGAQYLNLWKDPDQKTVEAIHNHGTGWWEFPVVCRTMEEMPEGTCLHLANSMPVRWANFMNHHRKDVTVYANRGTSGIDGCLSTAVGCAMITSRPVLAILGDMSFIYDRNGLWHPHLPSNLRILVVNNHGGGIFRLIDGPSSQPELETYFETDQSLTAENTARDFDLEYTRVGTSAEFEKALPDFLERGDSPKLLEVETESEANKTQFEILKKKLKESLT